MPILGIPHNHPLNLVPKHVQKKHANGSFFPGGAYSGTGMAKFLSMRVGCAGMNQHCTPFEG